MSRSPRSIPHVWHRPSATAGSLVLAARSRRSRDDRLPRRARTPTTTRWVVRPHGAGRRAVRRDPLAGAGDRRLGAGARRRLVVPAPHGRGQRLRDPLPRTHRRDRRRVRSCWTRTPRPTGTTSSPSARSRSAPDGHLAAWSSDTDGSERFTLRVRDLSDGNELDDVLDRHEPGPASRGRLGQRAPVLCEARRADRARSRSGGTGSARAQDDDVLVYEDLDERFFVGSAAPAAASGS